MNVPTRVRAGAVAVLTSVAVTLGPGLRAVADSGYPSGEDVRVSQRRATDAAERVGQVEAQLAHATATLDQAAIRAGQAAEAYNGAVARLELARAEAVAAQRRATEAAATEQDARATAGRFAAARYQHGADAGIAAVLLGASTPRELASQAAVVDQIARSQRAVIDDARAAGIVSSLMRDAAGEAAARAKQAAGDVAAAKVSADAAVAASAHDVAETAAQRERLTAELAELRDTSIALEEERRAGLEEERRQRAAAADRREAQAPAPAEQAAEPAPRAVVAEAPASSASGPKPAVRVEAGAASAAVAYARAQLGKPYEWAADGPASFDCSGLTMMAWRAAGVSLPHDSEWQYEQSTPVPLSALQPGDLIFFATNPDRHTSIYHVGLYLGDEQMIHAPYTGANVTVSSMWRDTLFAAARP